MSPEKPESGTAAALLIAHGSRLEAANQDLVTLADQLRARRIYPIVEVAYLELAEPTICDAGNTCVQKGATRVFLLPYFLSAGAHVTNDLERFRQELTEKFPHVRFNLCKPLSSHPLLVEIVIDRLRESSQSVVG
jgi:sirohydrochlorin ferrochelatase